MKKFLEKIVYTIIPHRKNNNIPYILRAEAVLIIIVIVGAFFYFNQNNLKIIKKLNLTAAIYPAVLADLSNRDRLNSGVSQLTWSDTLAKAAKLKAEDMLKNGYFAHTSPSGVTPWHWLSNVNYNFMYAGENLAINFTESENVERAWLNSPKHRDNIMSKNFTEIGIATAEGMYNGRNTIFVVEFFGKPLNIKTKEEPAKIVKLVDIEKEDKVNQDVAGVSVKSTLEEKDTIKLDENIKVESNIEVVEEVDDFIIVENNDLIEKDYIPEIENETENDNEFISTWYYRFIVNPTVATIYIYLGILGTFMISIILLLSIEYQRHHRKHIIMGITLIFLILVLIYRLYINI